MPDQTVVPDQTPMTKNEREELARVVRLKAKVAKARLETLAGDRRAEVEAQLSAIHRVEEVQWREIVAEADALVKAADAKVATICMERGIPAHFRPGLSLNWWDRGENASASRRAELRRLAYTRIDADRKAGNELVDGWAAEKLTVLIAGALTSTEAKAFLETLPAPEVLLPAVRITPELEEAATARLVPGHPRSLLTGID